MLSAKIYLLLIQVHNVRDINIPKQFNQICIVVLNTTSLKGGTATYLNIKDISLEFRQDAKSGILLFKIEYDGRFMLMLNVIMHYRETGKSMIL